MHKVTALLERLGEEGEAGVTELARHIGADKGVVHRILRTLRENEWVEQNPDNRLYSIGPALAELSARLPSRADLVAAAAPVLDTLVEMVDETCFLSGRQGMFNVVDLIRESSQEMRVVSQVGRRIPLHGGAAGKVLLAFERETIRERLLAHEMKALAERTITDRDRLRTELDIIRKRGWSYDDGENSPGICGLAAPILLNNRTLVGCICVRAPDFRLPFERAEAFAPRVVDAARTVAREVRIPG